MSDVLFLVSKLKSQFCAVQVREDLPFIPILVTSSIRIYSKAWLWGKCQALCMALNPLSGWINGEIWVVLLLLPFVCTSWCPLLLLLDGHSLALQPNFHPWSCWLRSDSFWSSTKYNTCYSALDFICFYSLRAFWMSACILLCVIILGRSFQFTSFQSFLHLPLRRISVNIPSSFRATGVSPLNRRAIPIPGDFLASKCSATPTTRVAKSHGIEFLLFYTPVKSVSSSARRDYLGWYRGRTTLQLWKAVWGKIWSWHILMTGTISSCRLSILHSSESVMGKGLSFNCYKKLH